MTRNGTGLPPCFLLKKPNRPSPPSKDNPYDVKCHGLACPQRCSLAGKPERYGPWEMVYSRFRKWIEDGYLDNIFRALSLEAELQELSLDASIVKAHLHSAGAKKEGPQV